MKIPSYLFPVLLVVTGIIDINQLADGVYQIMIKTEDNIKVLPLIKIK